MYANAIWQRRRVYNVSYIVRQNLPSTFRNLTLLLEWRLMIMMASIYIVNVVVVALVDILNYVHSYDCVPATSVSCEVTRVHRLCFSL
jgi:hypothetical protein